MDTAETAGAESSGTSIANGLRSSGAHPLTEAEAWRVLTRVVVFTFGLLLAGWLTVQLQTVVMQVLLAVIIAAGMTPLVRRLTGEDVLPEPPAVTIRRSGLRKPPRALMVLLLYLALLVVILTIGALVIPPVLVEVEDLIRGMPAYAADFQNWVAELPQRFPFLPAIDLSQNVGGQLQAASAQLMQVFGQALGLLRVFLSVLSGALNGVFILVMALYFTEDSERIQRYVIGFLPSNRRDQAQTVARRIGERLGGWVRGQLLLSAIIGTITLVGLTLLDVRYAMLLSLVAAVGEAVPMIGPIFSAIPAVIIAFFQSPAQGFLTLGLYVIIQQLENNLVVPKVMERAVSLHPLAVMLALLAGGELMGVTGAILSVPLAAALAVVLDEWRLQHSLSEAGQSPGSPGGSARTGDGALGKPAVGTSASDAASASGITAG